MRRAARAAPAAALGRALEPVPACPARARGCRPSLAACAAPEPQATPVAAFVPRRCRPSAGHCRSPLLSPPSTYLTVPNGLHLLCDLTQEVHDLLRSEH